MRSTGSSPGLCRYNWKPQLLMGLMKGQPPGKQLCENDLGVLVDTLLNLHLKHAFVAKNSNGLWAECYLQSKEAFLLYSALVRQFLTSESSDDLPRAKDTRPCWSELREVPQRWLKEHKSAGATLSWRKTEIAGTVQPWEGSGGILPVSINTWCGGIKKMEPEPSHLYSATGQEERDKTEMHSIPHQHKKIPFLPWRQLNTRMSFPEKSRSPHPRICSNPA